ncbi:hypothetical protein [Natrinema amylolyticum]|uniref:hypothetical protein n=1 Tax=Natrinema amylolyticum TaxID=2878679 RepID=UPI001CFA4019|nr:hypothetical protein [Natrinema amylolyticum]
MKRKYLVVGVLVTLLVAGVGALFLFPLDTTSTEVPFEYGDSEQSASSGEIRVDGELFVAHEATVLGPDAAHVTHEYEQVTTEYFYEDGRVYTKYTTTADEDRESIRSDLETDDDVVHYGHHEDRVVLVTEGQGTYDGGNLRSTRSITTRPLMSLNYDQVEDGSDGDYAVYEPSSAWVKLNRSLTRIDPERGDVRTDPETDVLRSMSLELSLTQASSYGEYLLQREPDGSIHVEYEYDPDPEPTTLETPDWVEQCVENDDCEF